MTLYTADFSDYDWPRGPMDMASVAAAGISAVTHKLTEGRTVQHAHAGTVLGRARAAGIAFLGGYHVVHTADPAGQVDYLLACADRVVPWWPTFPGWFWQCDAERWATDFPPPGAVKDFCDRLAERTGRRVLCYASQSQYGATLAGLGHPLWNANYPTWLKASKKCPAEGYLASYRHSGGDAGPGWGSYSGQVPAFWQYSDNATIGSQPGCDVNAFRGTLDQLRALLVPVRREAEMKVLYDVPHDNDGKVWETTGPTRRWVSTFEELARIRAAAAAGALDYYRAAEIQHWDGHIGIDVTGVAPSALSAQDRAAIVADLLAGLGHLPTAAAVAGALVAQLGGPPA